MKAVVYYQYGSPDVLELKDVEKPIPKEGEVLIKVQATAVWLALSAVENRLYRRFAHEESSFTYGEAI